MGLEHYRPTTMLPSAVQGVLKWLFSGRITTEHLGERLGAFPLAQFTPALHQPNRRPYTTPFRLSAQLLEAGLPDRFPVNFMPFFPVENWWRRPTTFAFLVS